MPTIKAADTNGGGISGLPGVSSTWDEVTKSCAGAHWKEPAKMARTWILSLESVCHCRNCATFIAICLFCTVLGIVWYFSTSTGNLKIFSTPKFLSRGLDLFCKGCSLVVPVLEAPSFTCFSVSGLFARTMGSSQSSSECNGQALQYRTTTFIESATVFGFSNEGQNRGIYSSFLLKNTE